MKLDGALLFIVQHLAQRRRMSEVPTLYNAIKNSSGQERQKNLSILSQELASTSPSSESLFLGLGQNSSDVRQVVLDALSAKSHSSVSAKTFIAPILDIMRQSLRASNTSLSAIRLASSALKALSGLFNGESSLSPLTPLDMQALVEAVLSTMVWGLVPPTVSNDKKYPSNARQWRGGPGSAFAFDRRDSQGGSLRGMNSTILGRKSSSASLSSIHSEASTSATSHAADIETDHSGASDGDEEGKAERRQKKLKEARRGVRYRSINFIHLINEKYTRLLLLHWPRLLLDAESSNKAASLMDIVERDDSLSNRIAAVHAVQAMMALGSQAGFMAGAEEGSRLSAFTSLSSKMASMIVDLRRRLLGILADGTTPPSLLEATLKCTRTLVVSTPLVKLRASHSQVLRETTLRLCSRPEAASAVSAYSLLSALVASDKEGGRDLSAGHNILITLQDTTLPLQIRVEAWNTMTALAEKGAMSGENQRKDVSRLLQEATSPQSPLELRQGAANFVQACLSGTDTTVDQMVLERLYSDASPIIRSIAANFLLAEPGNEHLLCRLLSDSDTTVRASAIRAVGVKIQSESRTVLGEEICRLVRDESLLVRMRASWSLGNLCEVSHDRIQLLKVCSLLKDDDERVSVNAIRGIGALLSQCEATEVTESQNLIQSILDWLLTALENGGPKLRWNVSACLARSLTVSSTCQLLASLQDTRLACTLAIVIVQDDSFKVRLSAVQALLRLVEHKCLDAYASRGTVKQAVEKAVEKVGDQINQASFREAQLHAIPLQRSLGGLSKMLQSNDDV